MKRFKTSIKASEDNKYDSEIVFTPASLLDLLSQIDELGESYIDLAYGIDDTIHLTVGESVYAINPQGKYINDVEVDSDVVDDIQDIDETTYEELETAGIADGHTPIESGLVKETLKTLLIGGVVRLGKKYLDSKKA